LTVVATPALIRDLREGDLQGLLQLAEETENFGPEAVDTERLDISRDSLPGLGKVFVAEVSGRVIGYLALRSEGKCAAIDSILVKKGYRQMGVGREMVRQAEEYARALGAKELLVETGADMVDAIRFYLNCGFKISGFSEHSSGSEGQVHMSRDL
jgi:ribosomal protein S18 acetylase RimI-like enzyme